MLFYRDSLDGELYVQVNDQRRVLDGATRASHRWLGAAVSELTVSRPGEKTLVAKRSAILQNIDNVVFDVGDYRDPRGLSNDALLDIASKINTRADWPHFKSVWSPVLVR